jgi:hypothetical protein
MKKRTIKGYICNTGWDFELGEALSVEVYSSIEALKEESKCWETCGITEIEIKFSKQISPSKRWKSDKED